MSEIVSDQPAYLPVNGLRSRASKRQIVFVAWIIAGLLFFSLTSPKSVPSVILVVAFFVIGTILYAGFSTLLLITGVGRRLSATSRGGMLVIVSVLPVLLLMLQSIGQLSIRDILTLGCLFFIGMFYISRVVGPAAKTD